VFSQQYGFARRIVHYDEAGILTGGTRFDIDGKPLQ